jgi:hypothetical protein
MVTAHLAIARANNHWYRHLKTNAIIHPNTRKEMEHMTLMKDPPLQPIWTQGFGNKCGRLFQGIRDIPGTETCFLIKLASIPTDRKITYGKIVCDNKPHKKEKEHVWLTVDGDIIDFPGRHHNIQNPSQHPPPHRGRHHDYDGHKELLPRHPAVTL